MEEAAVRSRGPAVMLVLFGLFVAGVALVATYRDTLAAEVRHHRGVNGVEAHRALILAAAREAGVDPYLLAGMVFQESKGDPGAVSPVGALGLMQLRPETARERAGELGLPAPTREDLLGDPALNLRLGVEYLVYLERRYGGDVEAALCAYNGGPTRLDRWIVEAGGYASWLAKQEREGTSQVLGYARSCLLYADIFRDRGLFEGL